MVRFKMLNSNRVQLTSEEETARDAEEKTWTDEAPARRMVDLRQKRDALLAETDWMANKDVTLTTAWKLYRQKLRDLPATANPTLDEKGNLTNVTWPTKPE